MSIRFRSFALLSITTLLVLVAIGCTSSESATPGPTATPVPTATPTPLPLAPITINPEDDPEGFVAALPQDEVRCAADAVGGTDVFTQLIASEDTIGDSLTDSESMALSECVSSETVQNVAIGQMVAETGGLSPDTIRCVAENLPDVAFSNVVNGIDLTGGDAIAAVEALFCLSPEERLAFEQSNASDEGESRVGLINGLECVSNASGVNGLETFAAIAESDGPPDFALLAEIMPVMNECGVFELMGVGDTGITGDQLTCLFTDLDPEVLNSMVNADESAPPDLAALASVLEAFQKCGIELEGLGGPGVQ